MLSIFKSLRLDGGIEKDDVFKVKSADIITTNYHISHDTMACSRNLSIEFRVLNVEEVILKGDKQESVPSRDFTMNNEARRWLEDENNNLN